MAKGTGIRIVLYLCGAFHWIALSLNPALTESLYKDIPKLPEDRLKSVSSNFGIAEVRDFDPNGDLTERSIPWPTISRAVLARDNYECRICGKSSLTQVDQSAEFNKIHFELEVHHIVPRKNGGKDTFRNLISLCEACHHETYSNGYAGIPSSKNFDLFSFEKKFYFAIPPDSELFEAEETITVILEGYDRMFDQNENKYRVIQLENARMKLQAVTVNVESYRKLVSQLVNSYDIADYITLNARFSGHQINLRTLIDSSGDPIV